MASMRVDGSLPEVILDENVELEAVTHDLLCMPFFLMTIYIFVLYVHVWFFMGWATRQGWR